MEFVEVRTFVFILLHVGRGWDTLHIHFLFSIVYSTKSFEEQAQKKRKKGNCCSDSVNIRLFIYHISDLFPFLLIYLISKLCILYVCWRLLDDREKFKWDCFFPQSRTRSQELTTAIQTELRPHYCVTEQSGYWAWCVWETPEMQRSVTVSYWPLPHLPVGSSFGWLNSFVKSIILEISKGWALWSLFYCLAFINPLMKILSLPLVCPFYAFCNHNVLTLWSWICKMQFWLADVL